MASESDAAPLPAPARGPVNELRFVLPASVVESHRRVAGESALGPHVLGFDPALPRRLAITCGGCWRLRVRATSQTGAGELCRLEYHCILPVVPVTVLVVLHVAIVDGDCTQDNALRLGGVALAGRSVERVEVIAGVAAAGVKAAGGAAAAGGSATTAAAGMGTGLPTISTAAHVSPTTALAPTEPPLAEGHGALQVTTVYCAATAQAAIPGLWGVLAWPLMLVGRHRLEAAARAAAQDLLKRHWRMTAQRWVMAGSDTPEDARPATPPRPGTPSWRQQDDSGKKEKLLDFPDGSHSPKALAAEAAADLAKVPGIEGSAAERASLTQLLAGATNDPGVLPAIKKGMPLFNGFLYKLGDGMLNTTWNLRYFLLIGSTLQYYRTQHEAKPRDVINLSGATVQRTKDATRPFTFSVLKDGQRTLCLSGQTEKETGEWVERIQAASKLTPVEMGSSSAPSSACRRSQAMSFWSAPAPAADVPDELAEAGLQACAQVLTRAASGTGFCLRELRHGLRITEPVPGPGSAAACPGSRRWVGLPYLAIVLATVFALQAMLGLNFSETLQLWSNQALIVLVVLALLYRAAAAAWGGRGTPIVCAASRMDGTVEELREILTDPSLAQHWCPGHLDGRLLSLSSKDEVLHTRFQLGLFGASAALCVQRRWVRKADGVRLLCCAVGDSAWGWSAGGGKLRPAVTGFEGFALIPGEEGSCTVFWMCALGLASWAPRRLREHFALERVSALAGLREWLASQAARRGLDASFPREQAVALVASQTGALLRGLQSWPAGGLFHPLDLDRAATSARLALDLGQQFLRGTRQANVELDPSGLLPAGATGVDLAQRYAARWAFASAFLEGLGSAEARERLELVVAFMVAGLHLTAAAYPHFPWVVWLPGAQRHSAVMPDDTRVRVEVGNDPRAGDATGAAAAPKAGKVSRAAWGRKATFEVVGRAASGFRIFGTDEVVCHVEMPGALRFVHSGVCTVELSPAGPTVRFTMPQLRVLPSAWTFGSGSVYEWLGNAHFVDEQGGLQCDLTFGPGHKDPRADAVVGTVRDALGVELGRLHGSWLGTLARDSGEVLWRGPRQPAPF